VTPFVSESHDVIAYISEQRDSSHRDTAVSKRNHQELELRRAERPLDSGTCRPPSVSRMTGGPQVRSSVPVAISAVGRSCDGDGSCFKKRSSSPFPTHRGESEPTSLRHRCMLSCSDRWPGFPCKPSARWRSLGPSSFAAPVLLPRLATADTGTRA